MSSTLFARWFGFVSVILALGILFNLEDARKMAKNMVETETGYIMGGVLPIIFGSLCFMQHYSFNPAWDLVVTLIGLAMLLIGIFRVFFVDAWKKLMRKHLEKIPTMFSLFGLMLGLLLLYAGFFAPVIR